jgi:hypothetical protein
MREKRKEKSFPNAKFTERMACTIVVEKGSEEQIKKMMKMTDRKQGKKTKRERCRHPLLDFRLF